MTKEKSEFQWIHQSEACEDEFGQRRIFESHIRMMQRLFAKHPKSLVNWHRNRVPGDLHLYAAFGFMNPIEYEYFQNQLEHLREKIADQFFEQLDDDAADVVQSVLVPDKKVGDFLQCVAQEDFDHYENLLMRFAKPVKLIKAVENALFNEGMRTDRRERVSVVDELLCQSSVQRSEKDCWMMMNCMVANNTGSPMQMALDNTSMALKQLNEFELDKAVAAIHDYSLEPKGQQRLNGKWTDCWFLEKIPRIQGALYYLKATQLLDEARLNKVVEMTPEQRETENIRLKRNAVSAFLSDIVQAAPDELWLNHIVGAFSDYFRPILDTIGRPVLATGKVAVDDKDGNKRFVDVVHVSFPKMIKDKHNSKPKIPAPKTVTERTK